MVTALSGNSFIFMMKTFSGNYFSPNSFMIKSFAAEWIAATLFQLSRYPDIQILGK